MGIQKFRIAWKFTATYNSIGTSTSSHTFKLCESDAFIDLNFKTLPSSNLACSFNLRFDNDCSVYHKRILQCSYYMLNEAGDNHKLVNFSPFMTDWFELGNVDRMDYIMVLAWDTDHFFNGAAEHWLEGTTEALNHTMWYSSGSFHTFINGKRCLKFHEESSSNKSISIEGLEQDEIIKANVQINDTRSNGADRNLIKSFRSNETSSCYIALKEHITKVELISISTAFKAMGPARISELTNIIENLDLLPNEENLKQNVCKLSATIQPEKTATSAASSTCIPNKESITESLTLTSPIAATVTALLAQQTEYVFKCFTESKFCDIAIQVRDGQEIRAHKNMLCSGSAVWRQILSDDDQLSIIAVADFERETIETLVTYIYINSVPKPPEKTDQLLIAAETYGVDGLKAWCEQELMPKITIDSAITLLVLAHRYNAKKLFDEVWKFVGKHTDALKQRKEWKSAFFSYPEMAFELFNSLL